MKLAVFILSFVILFFLTASQIQAQRCGGGSSCLDVTDTRCASLGGSVGACNSDHWWGNCCAPHVSCATGSSCLSLTETECLGGGGSYNACHTGFEEGTCCSPAFDCQKPIKCFSLSKENCRGAAGDYGACNTDSGTGNCCVNEIYCSFPSICLNLTPYDCTEAYKGTIGACSTTIYDGNCCAFMKGPPVPIPRKPPPLFCVDDDPRYKTGSPDSGKIATAIGCLPITNNLELTEDFLGWGMGLGGGVAFILIIFAGLMIMTSGGDPKKLAAGKELLTAAIAGLLLVITGVYLLRFIGVDILNLF